MQVASAESLPAPLLTAKTHLEAARIEVDRLSAGGTAKVVTPSDALRRSANEAQMSVGEFKLSRTDHAPTGEYTTGEKPTGLIRTILAPWEAVFMPDTYRPPHHGTQGGASIWGSTYKGPEVDVATTAVESLVTESYRPETTLERLRSPIDQALDAILALEPPA